MKKLYTMAIASVLGCTLAMADTMPTLPLDLILSRAQLAEKCDAPEKAPLRKGKPNDLGGNFTSWEFLSNGHFNNDLQLTKEVDVEIYWCTTDPSGMGMGVDSWYYDGLFNGVRMAAMPFISNYSINSGETGYTYQGKPVMYDDIKYHYNVDGVATGYDETMGLFTLGILYYVDDPDVVDNVVGFGNETIQRAGEFKDFRVSLDVAGETVKEHKLKVVPSFVDAKDVKLKVYPQAFPMEYGIPGEELTAAIKAQRADQSIKPLEKSEPLYFDMPQDGTYTVIITYTGEDDAEEYLTGEYTYSSKWSDYGTAEFTDDYLASYYDEFPIITVKDIKVQKLEGKDVFRLINPWTTDGQFTAAYSRLQPYDPEIESYYVVNAERADKVYIEINPTDITYDDGVRMVAGSAAHYNIINGRDDDAITARGYWGTIKTENGVSNVTFPRMTLMMRPINSMSPMFAGYRDSFKLVMTKNGAGVSDITIDDENVPVIYFNLQGMRVENPSGGIFIRRQGTKTTKVVVK